MDDKTLLERYGNVLQNLETAILEADDAVAELSDGQVELALEALIRYYQAKVRGHEPRPPRLGEGAQTVFDAVQPVAEAQLGLGAMHAAIDIGDEDEDEDGDNARDLSLEEVSELFTQLINEVVQMQAEAAEDEAAEDEALEDGGLEDAGTADEGLEDAGTEDGEVSLGNSASGKVPPIRLIEPVSHDTLVACLKRIRKSVRYWTKQGGRRGYLAYVREFLLSPDESE